jgi:hypothetical protein
MHQRQKYVILMYQKHVYAVIYWRNYVNNGIRWLIGDIGIEQEIQIRMIDE